MGRNWRGSIGQEIISAGLPLPKVVHVYETISACLVSGTLNNLKLHSFKTYSKFKTSVVFSNLNTSKPYWKLLKFDMERMIIHYVKLSNAPRLGS